MSSSRSSLSIIYEIDSLVNPDGAVVKRSGYLADESPIREVVGSNPALGKNFNRLLEQNQVKKLPD